MMHIHQLTLHIGDKILLSDLCLQIAPGHILTIMGPSGSGKSTILNWIVGVLDSDIVSSGELWLNGKRCDTLPIEQRRIGILFQDDLLFPHLSIGSNLALALPPSVCGQTAKETQAIRRAHVESHLDQAGLSGFHQRDPATLSGGQRARISLLRAMMAEREALLLDEAFSKLDLALRTRFRKMVFSTIRQRCIPAILVTHDPADIPPDFIDQVIELGALNS